MTNELEKEVQYKLDEARKAISGALQHARQPAILFSGGKESCLLLHLLDEIDTPRRAPLLCFYDETLPPERLRFVEEVFMTSQRVLLNFRPKFRSVMPTDEGYDLMAAYDLGGTCLPVLTTVYDDGSKHLPCALDWMRGPRKDCPEFGFDILFAGGRFGDTHQWFGSTGSLPQRSVGKVWMVSPLWMCTESDVWTLIKHLGVSYDEERYERGSRMHLDEASMCCRCLQRASQSAWCAQLEREIFL